jgi:predicted dehydrogenase
MKQPVKVALIGISGYGHVYVNQVLDLAPEEAVVPVAAIARRPERCARLGDLKKRGIPIYGTPEEFFAEGTADLVMIASPHHLHCPYTCLALSHGANVLCEKPVAPTIQEALQMKEAEQRAGRFVAIGYQWSYSDAIQSLKREILSGAFGKPVRLKSLVCWPRRVSYYLRNDWAAKVKTDDGRWILDSPIMNATAHYLHNMLYLLGPGQFASARPLEVVAELYRVNEIQNFDVGALRCKTENGAEVLFFSAHAVNTELGPLSHFQFEKADVYYGRYDRQAPQWIARWRDGSVRTYGNPNDALPRLLRPIESVRTGAPVCCGIEAASAHLRCVNGAQESVAEVRQVPPEFVKVEGEGENRQFSILGLEDAFIQCYTLGVLPSEHGDIAWTRPGRPVDLRNYTFYPTRPK